jgi:hypothetical protein
MFTNFRTASKSDTSITSQFNAVPKPLAVANPIFKPVELPGPFETIIDFIFFFSLLLF